MQNTGNGGPFQPWLTRGRSKPDEPTSPAAKRLRAIFLAILVPCAALTALLLVEFHARERSSLETSARTRAALAAARVDQDILGLVRTLNALPPTSVASPQSRGIVYAQLRSALDGTGIDAVARSSTLDLLSAGEVTALPGTNLDEHARKAALTALKTHHPQITPVTAAAHGNAVGFNLWVATGTGASQPLLWQAHIPASYFGTSLKDFTTGGTWMVAVAQPDGQILARFGGRPAAAGETTGLENDQSVIEVFADTSQFGWRVGAATPLMAFDSECQRNWIAFLLVTMLLTTASFAGATVLSRTLSDTNNASPSQIRTLAAGDPTGPGASASGSDMLIGGNIREPRQNSDRPARQPTKAESRLRAALCAGGMGVWEWNRLSGSILWDAKFADVLKLRPGADGPGIKQLLRRVDRQDRRRLFQAVRAAMTNQQPLTADVRLTRFDGEQRWIAIRGAVVKDGDTGTTGLLGIGYDVTEQRRNLSRTDALLREVSHRSKNLLALILAMARLTAREALDVRSHLKDFALRVTGLAASQDLIVASDWQSVDLGALAFAEIEAVARADATRVTIKGPSFLVTPEAAQTLGMILTELTLNAVEHGALSTAEGRVNLTWEVRDDDTIAMAWTETGGPPFDPSGYKGYGMAIVERFSSQGLKANSRVAADANGFRWTLTGSAAHFRARQPAQKT